jgi:ATP-dependent helicase/nuclease subunit B
VADIKAVLEEYPYYASRISYLNEISKNKEFKIENKELMKKIYSDTLNISATEFEEFNLCHFKFFCNTGLKLKTRRKKEIGNLEQGNLVHKCLECILSSCKNKDEFDNLTVEIINELIQKCIDEYFNENMGGTLKRTARLECNIKNIKENISKIILHLQNELKQSEFRPAAFEVNINEKGMPILKADNGVEVILRGVVDRVDIYDKGNDKYVRVIDYKTGKKVFSISSLLYGLNMQMLLYMFSITGENGKFSDCEPAGVLYMPANEIVCDRGRDDSSDINDYLLSHYKMNGVVLEERMILNAMEKDIQGIYIPAKLLKGDSGNGELLLNKKSSSCLTASQFKKLREYTRKLMKELCEKLYDGSIEANPLIYSGAAPCDYCDYWSVCGNIPCEKFHNSDKSAKEEMMKIMSEKEE